MRYNITIQRMQKEEKYAPAILFLDSIAKGKVPPAVVLKAIYGSGLSEYIKTAIKNFLKDKNYAQYIRRKHQAAPNEIDKQRTALENDPVFRSVQSKLLYNELPENELLEKMFGEYTEAVKKSYNIFLQLGLKRKCGISSTTHHNRVAAVTRALKMDESGTHRYTAVAGMHDLIEDTLNILKDKNGRYYGIHRYDEFLSEFIPEKLHEHIKLLTNNYDLILGHIHQQFLKTDRSMTKKNLLKAIEVQSKRNSGELHEYFEKMYSLLYMSELGEEVYKNAKWICYENLYIHNMALSTKQMNDFRTFQIKAVDLLDNSHGRDSLSMEGRIKNIIKLGIWASEGYKLQSDWPPLNAFVMEVHEEALVHAEHMVIKDLFELQSQQDFLVSALIKFDMLKPVFYSDFYMHG